MPAHQELSELLNKARQGDAAALEGLLHAVQPQLFRFSMKMCRHTEDAEDVLQDAMIALARSIREFRGDASLSTWLYSVARSMCIKKRRKSKFAPEREESLEHLPNDDRQRLESERPTPYDQAERAETWQLVRDGIARIEPAYREILVLRDIEGLRAKEVAAIVGISVAAVKSRLHRARSQLRQTLAERPYITAPGCPDIHAAFSQHLEGDLSADMCSSMEAHVASCTTCAAECEGLKSVLNACSSAPCEVPEHVQRRVKEALKQVLDRPTA